MFQKKKWYIVFFLLILCLSVSAALGENILKFPKKLTEIKAEAFYGDVSLQSVVLPEGINSIGDLAFANSSLAKINLPASLKYISKNAFDGCENFEISVVKGSYAFEWCKENDLSASITEDPETVIEYFTWEAINDQEAAITGYIGPDTKIKIPAYVEDYTITTIADCAFEYNDALSVVILADSIKKIGEYAFYGCSGLTEVVFGNSLNSIGDNAFSDCAQITNIEFPEGIEQIGSGAFWYCASIKEIELPNSISEIGSYAFAGCSSLVSVKLPSMVSIIADGTFMDCTGMVEISIADGITEVGNYAFEGCVMLETIKLPESMDIIGTYAFMDCERLENVYLPDNITELGAYAFGNCVNLKSINIPMSWKWVVSNGPVFENCKELSHFVIPEGMESLPDYAFYRCTYLESIDLPSTLKRIGSFAFENCTKIKNIEIPDGVIEIGESAFSGCTGLGSIDLPECLKTIEHYAFKDCVGFTRIHLPAGIEKLRTGAFEGCINIENISIAEGLVKLPDAAFYGLEYLKNVELPSTLNWIGDYAFEDCTGITSIQFPDNVISIGESAFSGCVNLENISLPEGLLYIEFYAFKDCIKLTEIYLPDSITRLKGGAFSGCINLERINIPLNWRDTIGDTEGIFEGCNKLISIELPEGMEHLPAGAFSGCAYLENISMPSSLKSIGANAFYGCTGITSLTIPEGVVEIGNFAFDECVNLERLYLPSSVSDIGLMLFDCDNLRIDCEYGSYALQYAMDHWIPYFYLSLTDSWYPSGTLYKGDVYTIKGMVRSSENIDNVTIEVLDSDGETLVRSGMITLGNTNVVNINQSLNHYINISTLETGSYIYKISATAGGEREKFIVSSFSILPQPVRISVLGSSYPTGVISSESDISFAGTISSNYELTEVSANLINSKTGAIVMSWNAAPQTYSYDLQALCGTISTSSMDNGIYRFVAKATANGVQRSISNASFIVGGMNSSESSGEGTDTLEERSELALKLVSDSNNRKAFNTYNSYVQVFDELGYDDALNMALNIDYLSEGWNFIVGLFKGHGANESIVKLYKKSFAEIINKSLASQENQFTADNTDAYKLIVDAIKTYGKIETDSLEKLFEGKIVDPAVVEGFEDIVAITETADLLSKFPGAVESAIDIMEVLLRDYEGGYRLLTTIKLNTQATDDEFNVALNQLLTEYTDAYMNGCSKLIDHIIEEASKNGIKAAMKYLTGANYTLAKLGTKIILEVTGSSKAADNYQEFYVNVNLYCDLLPAYYRNFDRVANGDHSNTACEDLYNSYIVAHQAGLQMYDAAIKVASSALDTTLKIDKDALEELTFSHIANYGISCAVP